MDHGLWHDLTRVALTGTDGSRLSGATREGLDKLGVDSARGEAETLLRGIARVSRRRRAGYRPAAAGPPLRPAPEDREGRVCSPRSAHHLSLILEGPFERALPEFVAGLRRCRRHLPPESLPELLDRCRQEPGLWPDLEPALGARGAWLIDRNPYWQPLRPKPDPEAWPHLPSESRLALLRQWRRENAETMVVRLRARWPQLSWREKLPLLDVFDGEGEHAAEEAFLEECLGDGRKEVRMRAADRLAHRPGSALVRRATEWARQCLSPDASGQLAVTLPSEPTEAMRRDAIPDLAVAKGKGLRLGRLLELVRRTPPTTWESWLAGSPAECLTLFAKTEYASDLLEALTEAVARFRSERWMGPLFRGWTLSPDRERWRGTAARKLMRSFPPEVFADIAREEMSRGRLLVEEESPFGLLLQLGVHPWPDDLSLHLVRGFQHWLGDAQTFFWNTWHYKALWQVAAYRASPRLFEPLREEWPRRARQWPAWEKDIERFLRTLLFRRDMLRELENE